MFRTSQMITSTQLLRHYALAAEQAYQKPEPILITQRNGKHLVLMSADFFELLFLQSIGKTEKADLDPGIKERVQSRELGV